VDPWGLDWFDNFVNFATGFTDSLTFGITDGIRELIGLNDVVDHESGYYIAGEATEIGIEIIATGGSATLKHLAREGGERATRRAYREAAELYPDIARGQARHHRIPLNGHPVQLGAGPSLFPTNGLPVWLNTNRFTIRVVTAEEHLAAHVLIKLVDDGPTLHDRRSWKAWLQDVHQCP
jgi:hypothetical protein